MGDGGSVGVGGCWTDRILLLGKPGDLFINLLLQNHYMLNILLDTAEDKKVNRKLPGFILQFIRNWRLCFPVRRVLELIN